jgi:hypothetical protein
VREESEKENGTDGKRLAVAGWVGSRESERATDNLWCFDV